MEKSKKTQGSLWLIVGIVVVVALAAGAGAYWYLNLRTTPEKTVRAYMDASIMGDSQGAIAELSAKSAILARKFGGTQTAPFLKPDRKELAKSYTFGNTELRGGTAYVPLTVKIPPDFAAQMGTDHLTLNMALVKERGKWKVDLEQTVKAMRSTAVAAPPAPPAKPK